MKKSFLFLSLVAVSFSFFGCNQLSDSDNLVSNENNLNQNFMKLEPKSGDVVAKMITNMGEIDILLYTDEVPNTAKNFVELAKQGKYDGVIFHRVIDDFMIQGGDFENGDGTGGYTYKGEGTSLDDEFVDGIEHVYGAVSMANAGPNTGGSQFFIVQKKDGTDWLNGHHSVFGYVYNGMDVVEQIANVDVDMYDAPMDDVVIESVKISEF